MVVFLKDGSLAEPLSGTMRPCGGAPKGGGDLMRQNVARPPVLQCFRRLNTKRGRDLLGPGLPNGATTRQEC